MKTFNITGLIVPKSDLAQQSIFMNEMILALCEADAELAFRKQLENEYRVIKVYSIEEIV